MKPRFRPVLRSMIAIIGTVILFWSCEAAAVRGQETGAPDYTGRLQLVNQYLNDQFEQQRFVGGAYSVVYRDTILSSGAFGSTDMDSSAAPTPQTVYSVASLTKLYTAAAVLLLQDQGLLQIDDPVRKHIPWFRFKDPQVSERLTIRQLLTHTAGGLDSSQTDPLVFEPNAKNSLENYIRAFRTINPSVPLGTEASYCNGCYDLLGLVIEKVSGMNYYDFMDRYFFTPLHMTRSQYSNELLKRTDLSIAKEYSWLFASKVSYTRTFQAFGTSVDPDGGLYSTAEDMSRFMAFQLGYGGGPILSNEALKLLWQTNGTGNPSGDRYTLGGYEPLELYGARAYFKDGDGIGSATAILMIPELELGVSILIGEFHPGIQQPLVEGAAAILLGHEAAPIHSSVNIGQLIGYAAIVLTAIAIIMIVLLAFKLFARRSAVATKYRKLRAFVKAAATVLCLIMAVPLWIVFAVWRPTGVGFHGIPYDLAIGIAMLAAASTAWFLYSMLRLMRRFRQIRKSG